MMTSLRLRAATAALAVLALVGGIAHAATSAENGSTTVAVSAAAVESGFSDAAVGTPSSTHDVTRGLADVTGCALLMMLGCIAVLRRRHDGKGASGRHVVTTARSHLQRTTPASRSTWRPDTSLAMLSVSRT